MADAILLSGREKRVYSCHPWIFESDISKVVGNPLPGDIVNVLSANRMFIAKAYYNPKSKIALRVMSLNDEPINQKLILSRIHDAVEYRRQFADLQCCRVVFAESDRIPALIVDSFGSILVLQSLSLGIEKLKPMIISALIEELRPEGIYERSDVPVRELEGLPQSTGVLYGTVPDRVEIVENGIRFLVDIKQGQKTGYFLDQKENRAAIMPFMTGKRVLDCFTHTGAFALHAAAAGADEVIGVDIAESACLQAAENAKINKFEDRVRFIKANAFDLLSDESRSGMKYDCVILDPPAFTKTRSSLGNALRGYKEINLRALRLIKTGGVLVTCSCSQHVSREDFSRIVLEASRDAHVQLRLIEFRTQGRDHPILPAAPETQYLKCCIYQVFR